MGLFSKLTASFTGTDADDIPNGVLASAVITGYQPTGTVVRYGTTPYRVCDFTLQVHPENGEPYAATTRQKIIEWEIARIQPGQTVCAVRIDPNDPQRVAIDFATNPPSTLAAQPNVARRSATEILTGGEACQAVIASFQDLGQQHPETGDAIYAFVLTVIPAAGDPYQAQVGFGVPAKALPKLFNGAQLPAKRMPDTPNEVVIDWDTALAS